MARISFKKVAVYSGHVLVLLSLVFIAFRLKKDFKSIPEFVLGPVEILAFLGAVLCNALVVVAMAFAWLILLGKKVDLRWRDAFSILGRAQMGKFVPGNIFQYVGRVSIAASYNVPAKLTILTTGMETILMILTAVALAFIVYSFDPAVITLFRTRSTSMYVVAAFVIAIAFLVAVIAIRSRSVRNWIQDHLVLLKPKRILQAVVLYLVLFALFGLSLKALLVMLGKGESDLSWFQLTGGHALAWLLGFITPGSPVGIGIRETVFFQLYHDQLGYGLAIGLALVARVAATAGDLVAWMIAHWIRGRDFFTEDSKVSEE